MSFLADNCTLKVLNPDIIAQCESFDCGHKDLNEFFSIDCISYSSQLLGKTYCFISDKNPNTVVCSFTVSNDSIKTKHIPKSRKKKLNKKIPHSKQTRSYPAVLIGRLGVNTSFKRQGIGEELMGFIKAWFIDSGNKTGCRYIVVDSYNEEAPLAYYKKNEFEFLFETEDEEKEFSGIPKGEKLRTRLMYFDLIILRVEQKN